MRSHDVPKCCEVSRFPRAWQTYYNNRLFIHFDGLSSSMGKTRPKARAAWGKIGETAWPVGFSCSQNVIREAIPTPLAITALVGAAAILNISNGPTLLANVTVRLL